MNRDQFPPGGFIFYEAATGWHAPTPLSSTFNQTVQLITKMRRDNPGRRLSTDYESIARDLENFTNHRLGANKQYGNGETSSVTVLHQRESPVRFLLSPSETSEAENLKIVIVYIYVPGDAKYRPDAARFIETYQAFPAGCEHSSVVVCNGAPPDDATRATFSSLKNLSFLVRDNSGYDIGGFQAAARDIPADLMVFFGSSAMLKGAGWLARMVNAFLKHGNALYGTMGHMGAPTYKVLPHIRTTGFWMPPALLNQYPVKVTTPDQRYPFEHGENCLTQWVRSHALKALVVGWFGEYEWPHWDGIPGGYRNGNQGNLICGDRLTEPPYYP